jgi:hypothetical protein
MLRCAREKEFEKRRENGIVLLAICVPAVSSIALVLAKPRRHVVAIDRERTVELHTVMYGSHIVCG